MAERKVSLLIRRQDKPEASSYWQEFKVPYEPQMNVISCLQAVAAEGHTAEGKAIAPVAWDSCCLEEVCGACTMVINGRVRQACSALVDDLVKDNDVIQLEPMSKFPVVRDLVVNRARMFNDLRKIRGWIPVDGYHATGQLPLVPPETQEKAYPISRCMTCGCCLEACPQVNDHSTFIGPAAIAQVVYFNMHPTGQNNANERLEVLMGPGGVHACGNAQNCVKVCPKGVPLTDAIGRAGRSLTIHAIKQWLET